MRQMRYVLPTFLFLATLVVLPGTAQAQDSRFTVGLFGGVGGSPDTDSFTEPSFQILGAMDWAPRTHVQLRLGQLDTAFEAAGGGTYDADLRYITVGTEYRVNADYYESGLVIGLGYYDLDGPIATLDDDTFGLNLGVTGDFEVSPRWSVLVELTGHFADFEDAQIFIMGHVGVGFRF